MSSRSEDKPEAQGQQILGPIDFGQKLEHQPSQKDKPLRQSVQLRLLSAENKALQEQCDERTKEHAELRREQDELKKALAKFTSHHFTNRYNDATESIKKSVKGIVEDDQKFPEQDPRNLRKLRDFLVDELVNTHQHVAKKRKRIVADEEE